MTCGNGWSAAFSGSPWGTRSGPRSSSGDARRSPTRCPRSSCRGRVGPPARGPTTPRWLGICGDRSRSTRRLDTEDVLLRHLEWLATDPPDVGNLTRWVLRRARDGDRDAPERYVAERGPEVSAGNGSVMYCAPLGAFRATHPELLLEEAPALSAITHWDERCRTACLAVTLAIAALVRGATPRSAVEDAVTAVLDREGGEELEYLVAEAGRARRIDGPDMGFALFTAGIGLQVAAEGSGFEEGLRRVVVARGRHGYERRGRRRASRGAPRPRCAPGTVARRPPRSRSDRGGGGGAGGRGDRLGGGRCSVPGHVLVVDPADHVDRLEIRHHPDRLRRSTCRSAAPASSSVHTADGSEKTLRDRVTGWRRSSVPSGLPDRSVLLGRQCPSDARIGQGSREPSAAVHGSFIRCRSVVSPVTGTGSCGLRRPEMMTVMSMQPPMDSRKRSSS